MSLLEAFERFSKEFKMEQLATRSEMQKMHVAFNAYVHEQEKQKVNTSNLTSNSINQLKLEAKVITSKKINLFILEFNNPEKIWILYQRIKSLIIKTTHIQLFRYLKLYNNDFLIFTYIFIKYNIQTSNGSVTKKRKR
jgi:urease accessory protein UreH